MNARFYVKGRSKTLTWIGCVCSIILVGSIVTLFFLYLRTHVEKVESLVNSFDTDLEEHQFFDMNAGKQIISLEYYHNVDVFIEYHRYVNFEFYHVTETPKKGVFQKTRLKSVPCAEVAYFTNDPNLIWLKDCLTFDSTTEIGYDRKTGTKKYIQVDIVPC